MSVVGVVGIAVAQARARPGLDSKKMHHTDVGGVRVKVHVKDVNLGRPAEQYLKITYSCRRVGEEPGCF
jgi:hypothetical protein